MDDKEALLQTLMAEKQKRQQKSTPAETTAEPSMQKISGGQVVGDMLKTAGILGVGGAAIGGTKAYMKPRQDYKAVQGQIGDMQKQVGTNLPLEDYFKNQTEDINEQATRQKFDINTQNQLKVQSLESAKQGISQASGALKDQLDTFDKTVLNKSIEDLGKDIKEQSPAFFKGARDSYGAGIAKVEDHFAQVNPSFSTNDFSDLLNDIKTKATSKGINPEKLKFLDNLVETDKQGTTIQRSMKFTQAKGYVSAIKETDPAVAAVTQDVWGEFLEKQGTGEIKSELGALNSKYRVFKNAETTLEKLSSSETGVFHRNGLNKMILDYVDDRRNNGIEELMDYISSGADKPMKGVGDKWKNFNELLNNRFGMQKTLKNLQNKEAGITEDIASAGTEKVKGLQAVETTIREKLDKINALARKSESLAADLEKAGERIPLRGVSVGKVLKGLSKIGAGKFIAGTTGGLLESKVWDMMGFDPVKILKGELPDDLKSAMTQLQSGGELSEKEKSVLIKYGNLS